MISEHLFKGRENARTGKELARLLDCNPRDISEGVERERRQGAPICASCDPETPGYYLAASAEDLEQYCRSLHKRAGEIHKTRRALLQVIDTLPTEQEGACTTSV